MMQPWRWLHLLVDNKHKSVVNCQTGSAVNWSVFQVDVCTGHVETRMAAVQFVGYGLRLVVENGKTPKGENKTPQTGRNL